MKGCALKQNVLGKGNERTSLAKGVRYEIKVKHSPDQIPRYFFVSEERRYSKRKKEKVVTV